MSFLQPWLLAALPLVSIPIIIHLMNQRRYQTVRWGAMMFLLQANRMARGFARLRQWLIMAFRMLAIAALVFAISRPLASGWLGLAAGGRPDTTIIVLDRSPSMQQRNDGNSKLNTGRRQLAQMLKTLGSAHWVLIESTTNKPRDLESPDAILHSSSSEPTSAASNLAGMLQAAYDYIKANKTGRTDIWICSDTRENDWDPNNGRWPSLRESFLSLRQGIRLNLLAYPATATGNVSIRVDDVRRIQNGDTAELVMTLRLRREGNDRSPLQIPVQLEVEGARFELGVVMDKNHFELRDYRIPLDSGRDRGWGKVTIPADLNPADNDYYFAFEKPVPRRAVIVADEPQLALPLQLAAAIAPGAGVKCSADVVPRDQFSRIEWERTSLLLWQGPLPEGDNARRVQNFVAAGGSAIFFPGRVPGGAELFGARWKRWVDTNGNEMLVNSWRGDQDLLAHTQSGAMLPVSQLRIRRYCELAGDFTPLATLAGKAPLLTRCITKAGSAYFLTTTTEPGDSSLTANGVVLYVLIHRAMEGGAAVLGHVGEVIAGDSRITKPETWQCVTGAAEAKSHENPFHRGVYATGERLLAVNRALSEDEAPIMAEERVASLFRGLDFVRVDHQAGHFGTLIEEIWRPFLASMLIALIVEGALCIPRSSPRTRKAA